MGRLDAVTTRSHEPVDYRCSFPRHDGDRLYERDLEARWVATDERARYARVLASELDRLRDVP